MTADASAATADVIVEGSEADGALGACEGAGDVDGDGNADLLVAGTNYGGTGAVFLLSGPASISVEERGATRGGPGDPGPTAVR